MEPLAREAPITASIPTQMSFRQVKSRAAMLHKRTAGYCDHSFYECCMTDALCIDVLL